MKKLFLFLTLLLGVSLGVACAPQANPSQLTGSANPQLATATQEILYPPTTFTPLAEIFRAQGDGPGQTQTFSIQSPGRCASTGTSPALMVSGWSCRISMMQAQLPYRQINLSISPGPSRGYNDVDLIAGQYYLFVQKASSAWTIWVQPLELQP